MPVNDELGKRMKKYEAVPQISLMRRTPVAIRIDGKAFHTFTRKLNKPWDDIFQGAMQDTMKYLCKNIQGCVFGYQQSDEITLILTDYETLTTDAWFGYEVQKLCSISASMATMKFNQAFKHRANIWFDNYFEAWHTSPEEDKYAEVLNDCELVGAMFDARCFNIPKEEVVNLVYWRQVDAIRNSIQSMAQANFSHKQLDRKNTKQLREMLAGIGKPWEDVPLYQQRGVACVKNDDGWYIDESMPIFKDDGRDYLERLI
jgi:tRNA(His) 5'-end guanylyltransferase